MVILQTGIFEKEYLVYGIILPFLSEDRKKKGLEMLPVPKCCYVHPDPGVLVMVKEVSYRWL